jgi:hypothetical protein
VLDGRPVPELQDDDMPDDDTPGEDRPERDWRDEGAGLSIAAVSAGAGSRRTVCSAIRNNMRFVRGLTACR